MATNFQVDFTRRTQYNEESSTILVRYGADGPVTELELNELQLIQNKSIRDLAKTIVSDGLAGKGTVSFDAGKLSIVNESAFVDGYLVYMDNVSLDVPVGKTAYLNVYVREVTRTSTMYKYGNLKGTVISNYINDNRFDQEITRREQLVYELSLTAGDQMFLEIGKYDAGEFVFTYKKSGAVIDDSRLAFISGSEEVIVPDEYSILDAQRDIENLKNEVAIVMQLKADTAVYVSLTGNDTTGDGTQTKPFKTITKALRTIPKNLGGYTATIYLADGSYGTNGFGIQRLYYNGILRMVGNESSPGSVIIPSTSVALTVGDNPSAKIFITGMTFTVTGNNSCIHVFNTQSVVFKYCIIEGNKTAGINWNTSALQVTDSVFNNCNICVWSVSVPTTWQTETDVTQIARIGSCTGKDNGSFIRIEKGIVQLTNNILPESTTKSSAKFGAMIIPSSGAITGQVQENTVYYVANDGSDSNTGTATSTPFKTIQHVFDILPKDLGGCTVSIYLADGTYDESVVIKGLYSGVISLKSTSNPETLNTVCKVKKVTVLDCSARIQLHGIYFTQTNDNAYDATNNSFLYLRCCQAIESAPSSAGFSFTYSNARMSGCRSLNHQICAKAFFSNLSSENWLSDSSAIEYGIKSDNGGVISKVGYQPSGDVGREAVSNGSIIISDIGDKLGLTLQSNLNCYVSPTGSDITGTGTSAKPYKTLQYTLSMVPKNLGGKTATIYIADGTYDEIVFVSGFYGGSLDIKSQNNPDTLNTLCRVTKILVYDCPAKIQFYGIYFTQKDDVALNVISCEMVYVKCCQAVESATSAYAFNFTYATARLYGCKSTNHRNCIRSYLSDVSSENWSADSSAVEHGISVSGGKLAKVGNQPSYQNSAYGAESVQDGGIIVSKYGGRVGALQKSITLYVDATVGNDTAGDGGSAKPYKTLQYTINSIPKDLDGYVATIQVADGTYDESVVVSGYISGTIDIRSQSSSEALNTVCRVKKISVANCSARIQFSGFYLTQTNDIAFDANNSSMVYIRCCQAIEAAGSSYAFNFTYSKARLSGCKSLNHSHCVKAYYSDISSENWSSSQAIEYGLFPDVGSKISQIGNQPTGTKGAELIQNGGLIIGKLGFKADALQVDTKLYVDATNGNDTTGDGTSAKPFKTIMQAINTLPKDLGNYIATISLKNGTYSGENILIDGFRGKSLIIDGAGVLTILKPKSFRVLNNSCNVQLSFFTLTDVTNFGGNAYLYLYNNSNIAISSCTINKTNSTTYGIAQYGGYLRLGNVSFKDFNTCICVSTENTQTREYNNSGNAVCQSNGCSGTGNSYFALVTNGAVLSSSNTFNDDLFSLLESKATNGGTIIRQWGGSIGSLNQDVDLTVDKGVTDSVTYKTVQSAILSLPKDLGGKTAHITINSDYVYNEAVVISDFINGAIDIQMAPSSENYTVGFGQLTIKNCSAAISLANIGLEYNTSSPCAVLISDCVDVILSEVIVTFASTTWDGIQIARSNVRLDGCSIGSRNNGIKVWDRAIVHLSSTYVDSNKVGISAYESCMVTIANNSTISNSTVKEFDIGYGAKLFQDNGTQIIDITKAGLVCSWATLGGGYVRHGNPKGGTAMITVEIRAALTMDLVALSEYGIVGLPMPAVGELVAVNCNISSRTQNCYIRLSNGYLIFKPSVNIAMASESAIIFTCTYLTNV